MRPIPPHSLPSTSRPAFQDISISFTIQMPALAAARAANASFQPAYGRRPVAVVLGGTAGIGAAIAQTLAKHLHGDLDVILVGRSAAGADAVFYSLLALTLSRAPMREFVRCDATLMRDVVHAAETIRAKVQRVNFLVLTPGVPTLAGRDETDEGLDRKLALHYFKLAQECACAACVDRASADARPRLMPLLEAARDRGEEARVMSVFNAAGGAVVDLSDLGLQRTYSVARAAS
jgi:NAD(P)-dependent dehydrogenase (short-subunit alcohol dehydrogenase family)